MGFTSVLKTIGLDAVKAVEGVAGGPKVIVQTVAQSSTNLRTVIDLVKQSEKMYAVFMGPNAVAGGSAKLTAIAPDVQAILGDVEILAGVKIASLVKDTAGFNDGVNTVISGLVKCLNACGQ